MALPFCMYSNIDEEQFETFNRLWNRYLQYIPISSIKMHSEIDMKYGVFNTWIRYTHQHTYLVLRPEKTLTYSFIIKVAIILRTQMPKNIKEIIIENSQDEEFLFLFSFFTYSDVIKQIDHLLAQRWSSEDYRIEDFYCLTDDDLENNENFCEIIKFCNFSIVNEVFTAQNSCSILICALRNTRKVLMLKQNNEFEGA